MPSTTVIRLLGVVQNPTNGFPARPLAINSWNSSAQHNALREAGDIKFEQYAEVPLLWLPSQVVVDPQAIEQFIWPGNIRAPFSHTEYITSALSR